MTLYLEERGSGPSVLLLHGLMATGDMFRWIAEPLSARFRLIIPDLPGHGRSAGVPGPYTVAAMAAQVRDALPSDEAVHVMGYSHGGTVAQQLAHDAPHLVRSLALVATYAHNTATRRERLEGWLFPRLLRVLGTRRFADLIARPGVGGGPALPLEQMIWLRRLFMANDTKKMALAAAELSGFDSRPWLSEIRVPTLVVSGGQDKGVPPHHAAMLAQGIAGARSITIADAGHTLVWTHANELCRILSDWWDERV